MNSVVVTQSELLAYAKEAAPVIEFKIFDVDTTELEKQGWERYNNGEREPDVMRMVRI